MTAWKVRMDLRNAGRDLIAAMQGDLATLSITEAQMNDDKTCPVVERLTNRILALAALYDPTLLDLNPEYVETVEQYNFPEA
jgi:hypothetical protein